MYKAEHDLTDLNAKINQRKLKSEEAIQAAASQILTTHHVNRFLNIEIGTTCQQRRVQIGKGRPGKKTQYRREVSTIYTLRWSRNHKTIREESRVDGAFPLLCTDKTLDAKKVLQVYKFQPRLEKRFCQFKWIHNAAPLLFKKIERVEANMFAFFIALTIQALIEREIRDKMKANDIPSLTLYPENREASHPTTSKIMAIFNGLSTYQLQDEIGRIEIYKDELTKTQLKILKLMEISEKYFWDGQPK